MIVLMPFWAVVVVTLVLLSVCFLVMNVIMLIVVNTRDDLPFSRAHLYLRICYF
jgi:hypothetical protein